MRTRVQVLVTNEVKNLIWQGHVKYTIRRARSVGTFPENNYRDITDKVKGQCSAYTGEWGKLVHAPSGGFQI